MVDLVYRLAIAPKARLILPLFALPYFLWFDFDISTTFTGSSGLFFPSARVISHHRDLFRARPSLEHLTAIIAFVAIPEHVAWLDLLFWSWLPPRCSGDLKTAVSNQTPLPLNAGV
jgi:hypothetical protein